MTFLHEEGATRVAWTDVHTVLGRFVDEVAKVFEQRKLAPYPWIAASKPRFQSAAKGLEAIALYCARPLRQVAELLEVPPQDVTSALGSGAADDPAGNALCQVLRDLPPFEEARALGHALLDPLRGEVLGAAATRWTQSVRRRRSGAFAAELLLPESALVEASGGHLDGVCEDQTFTKLIERYGVGATTAAWQLYNHKLVSPQARDEIIERHAGYGD
jgi:hypothetical protein